jgi:hypothetical protein
MTLAKDPKYKKDEENKHSTRIKESKHKDTFNTCSNKNPNIKSKGNPLLKPYNSSSNDQISMQSCIKDKQIMSAFKRLKFFPRGEKRETKKQD